MFCKNCGANNPDGSAFCSKCGSRFIPQPVSPPPQPPLKVQKSKTGLIVTVCLLAVIAAAGVGFLCFKLFSPPAVSGGFDIAYKDLIGDAKFADEGVANTPQTTAMLTPQPTTQNTLDLDMDFTEISYVEVVHSSAGFSDIAAFESILISSRWVYSVSHNNSDALPFNGGYVDIGQKDNAALRAYEFHSDSSVEWLNVDPSSGNLEYQESETFWTQQLGDTCVVLIDTGLQTVFEDQAQNVFDAMFIDGDGNLVEEVVLYNPVTEETIAISNYNVYVPETLDDLKYGDYMPAKWESQEQFEQSLLNMPWVYMENAPLGIEIVLPGYEDITPMAQTIYTFYNDSTLGYTMIDYETQEILYDDFTNYELGKNYAYIYIEQYEQDGSIYEVDYCYYIDVNGNLVECVMLYNPDIDEHYIASNANIYTPYVP